MESERWGFDGSRPASWGGARRNEASPKEKTAAIHCAAVRLLGGKMGTKPLRQSVRSRFNGFRSQMWGLRPARNLPCNIYGRDKKDCGPLCVGDRRFRNPHEIHSAGIQRIAARSVLGPRGLGPLHGINTHPPGPQTNWKESGR